MPREEGLTECASRRGLDKITGDVDEGRVRVEVEEGDQFAGISVRGVGLRSESVSP